MSAQYAKTSKNTFRNMALGFTGAMFIAAFALYASKKHVDGRRKADLESYEAGESPNCCQKVDLCIN
ncbi:MAG: hypothetical protein NXY57DRAFT_961346 [Lentinula lateritia]|uniref:Uncharacterized protein n=1 Tax=Lentinula lateritia TaxID=40482 RepID=A0ABQ8VM83_9AGAR|nr:MAG: hypothetical protein NXY57DRAFT_961346 [Lentinula lateritia]KAJ4497498.1 hypothetical protein C8R41DRAFT_917537 [Lentinula lateritia]